MPEKFFCTALGGAGAAPTAPPGYAYGDKWTERSQNMDWAKPIIDAREILLDFKLSQALLLVLRFKARATQMEVGSKTEARSFAL